MEIFILFPSYHLSEGENQTQKHFWRQCTILIEQKISLPLREKESSVPGGDPYYYFYSSLGKTQNILFLWRYFLFLETEHAFYLPECKSKNLCFFHQRLNRQFLFCPSSNILIHKEDKVVFQWTHSLSLSLSLEYFRKKTWRHKKFSSSKGFSNYLVQLCCKKNFVINYVAVKIIYKEFIVTWVKCSYKNEKYSILYKPYNLISGQQDYVLFLSFIYFFAFPVINIFSKLENHKRILVITFHSCLL